ncbi:MAG TPA: hypothetical protein VGL53_10495 [Bryobacteraceae bacterium]|jgi:hypothetical protein
MTKAIPSLLLASLALTVWGQAPTDIFEKAPPGVEDALRARVNGFYQTWAEAKFRAGEKFVSDSAQEFYYNMQKQKLENCEILRIKYERDFNDAIVTVACKGKWNIQGQELPSTLAHTDFWSLENDVWVWTVKPVKTVESPFGTFHVGEGINPETGLPKDQKAVTAMGAAILKSVSVDKSEVQLSSYEKATAVVTIKNGINGYIDIHADPEGVPPGFTATLDRSKIPGNETATLTLSYDPKKDVSAKSTAIVRVSVDQTNQMFPIRITFAIPPEVQKLIDKSRTGK